MVHPAGKDIVVHGAAPTIEPHQQAGPSVGEKFELNRATCFLLHHVARLRICPPLIRSQIFSCLKSQPRNFAVDR